MRNQKDGFNEREPRPAVWRTCVSTLVGMITAVTLAAAPATAAPPSDNEVVGRPFYLPGGPPGAAEAAKAKAEEMSALRSQMAPRTRMSAASVSVGPGTTVPYWSTTITSPLDGQTYNYSMVGSSPYDAHPTNTNVTYVPIVVRLHYTAEQVLSLRIPHVPYNFDPTQNGNCDTQPVARRFFNSPLFRTNQFKSNGVNVSNVPGGTQLISAFQRANFWDKVKGTNYGVTLVPSRLDPIVVDYSPTAPNDAVFSLGSACGQPRGPIAYMDINEYDALVQALTVRYASPTQVPVILVYNALLYIGDRSNCCVLGYHSALQFFDEGGAPTKTHLYAVGGYYDPTVFGPDYGDMQTWTHELAELIDDPFVQSVVGVPGDYQNASTPAWGHTGQVSGCQNNLEVGDPADDHQIGDYPEYTVLGTGGFLYHFQDEAFHDWFYRTPSTSAGHKGSFQGNLIAGGQGVCS